jgi:hypothetical protein
MGLYLWVEMESAAEKIPPTYAIFQQSRKIAFGRQAIIYYRACQPKL